MTVKELIKRLQEVDNQDFEVVFIDYENGETEITSIVVELHNAYRKPSEDNPTVVKLG